jgi:hypothetical protein
MESQSTSQFLEAVGGIVGAEEAQQLEGVIAYFERRLQPWWDEEAFRLESAQERLRELQDRADDTNVPQVMGRVASFLRTELPNQDLYFEAILAPVPSSESYGATLLGSHLVVEMVDEVTTEGMVSVAVHELTHYLYDNIPPEQHLALIDEFVASRQSMFPGLYTYLNEAIAVAAQALYADGVGQDAPGDVGGYDHPYIGPLGVAAAPLLRAAVEGSRTLGSGFADDYMRAGAAALGDKADDPPFVLAQVGIVLSEGDERLAQAYFARMFPRAAAQVRQESELAGFPELNVIRFARYDVPGAVPTQVAELASLRSRRGFAYALPRGPSARTYLLAGRDEDAILEVIERLSELASLGRDGVLLELV